MIQYNFKSNNFKGIINLTSINKALLIVKQMQINYIRQLIYQTFQNKNSFVNENHMTKVFSSESSVVSL
ncbi:hypothetical protein pb186bvf_007072 [Paramecium bursaria]